MPDFIQNGPNKYCSNEMESSKDKASPIRSLESSLPKP